MPEGETEGQRGKPDGERRGAWQVEALPLQPVITTVTRTPKPSCCKSSRHPLALAIALQTARPSPLPPVLEVREESGR